MQTFKKAIVSTVLFVVVSALLSTVFISASDNESLTIPPNTNYIFCGASHCEEGYVPDIIDRELHTHSFNVSVVALKRYGKNELLKNILPKFSVDTVVLDMTCFSFTRDESETGVSDMRVQRYYGNYIGPDYLLVNPFSLERLQETYNGLMSTGFDVIWHHIIRCAAGDFSEEGYRNYPKSLNRGFDALESVNVSLPKSEILNLYHANRVNTDYSVENMALTIDSIDICKKNGAKVIVAVTPVSDAFIWQYEGLDDFYDKLSELCRSSSCEFYDFNLLKSRYSHYSDIDDFYNLDHLSAKGAKRYSEDFCNIMKKVSAGEDISELFYNSYSEMEKDSPYYAYYNYMNRV